MSMEKHKCKLCTKKFLSGKALGGHMRSHLVPLPLPPKAPPLNQDSGSRSESTLSLCSSENKEIVEQEDFYRGQPGALKLPLCAGSRKGPDHNFYYGLRENPKKSFRMIDPKFFESETESEKNATNQRRRCKRSRKMVENDEQKGADFGSLSLFSDEEDIALCLMMLSRDVWGSSKLKPKYQCEICHKIFKTSQGLGSHKTIHKNKNYDNYEQEAQKRVSVKNDHFVDKKLHECPFCGKFFQSGQALGGHKRSHFVIMSSSSTRLGDTLMEWSKSANVPNGFIDLNMPAPDEDNDFNQPDFSAEDFQQEQELA